MAGGMIHHVRILETRPPDVTVRKWREIRHSTMKLMGLHWHQFMLPQHFAPNAKYVYHYKRRSKDYEQRKERAAKRGASGTRFVDRRAATDALTFSGTLRANVLQVAHIRSFEQRFKLVMPGTPYTPDRPRRPSQPPIAQEVTHLLEREKKELARLGKAHAVQALKDLREPTETVIQ